MYLQALALKNPDFTFKGSVCKEQRPSARLHLCAPARLSLRLPPLNSYKLASMLNPTTLREAKTHICDHPITLRVAKIHWGLVTPAVVG